jgi:hypothetical protein
VTMLCDGLAPCTDMDHVYICIGIFPVQCTPSAGSTAHIVFRRDSRDLMTGEMRQTIYATDIVRRLSNTRAKRPSSSQVTLGPCARQNVYAFCINYTVLCRVLRMLDFQLIAHARYRK